MDRCPSAFRVLCHHRGRHAGAIYEWPAQGNATSRRRLPLATALHFQCTQGYTPSTSAVCQQGNWVLADAAAAGGGCQANDNVDNATIVTAADESDMKWFEVLGYLGDWMPLLPLFMTLALVLLVAGAIRRVGSRRRAQVDAERARSCRPIDSVGHKFTVGKRRFGSLPPVITDPKERHEARNLASYSPQRGVPGATS